MIELNLQEDTGLQFKLDIDAESPVQEIRFTVSKDENTKVSFMGKLSEGLCAVDMASAPLLLTSGEYPCILEVRIGQNVFEPVIETLKVSKPASVKSTIAPTVEKHVSAVSSTAPVTAIKHESKPAVPPKSAIPAEKPITEDSGASRTIPGKLGKLNSLLS